MHALLAPIIKTRDIMKKVLSRWTAQWPYLCRSLCDLRIGLQSVSNTSSLGVDILAQAERDLEADLFLLARELLVPRHGFSPILVSFVRYSWTYDTERVKHVIGLMGAPFFFIYPTVPTVLYPTVKALN